MNRPGYNATRRNRNIGTEKTGHGQDNRLVIPWAWADDRIFYERLVDPIEVPVKVRSVSTHIIVEPPLRGFVHACTVDDILRVLQLMSVRNTQLYRTLPKLGTTSTIWKALRNPVAMILIDGWL